MLFRVKGRNPFKTAGGYGDRRFENPPERLLIPIRGFECPFCGHKSMVRSDKWDIFLEAHLAACEGIERNRGDIRIVDGRYATR